MIWKADRQGSCYDEPGLWSFGRDLVHSICDFGLILMEMEKFEKGNLDGMQGTFKMRPNLEYYALKRGVELDNWSLHCELS